MRFWILLLALLLGMVAASCTGQPREPVVFVPNCENTKSERIWLGRDFRIDLGYWRIPHPNATICSMMPITEGTGGAFYQKWAIITFVEE